MEQTEMFDTPKKRRKASPRAIPDFKPSLVHRPKRVSPPEPEVINLGTRHFINGQQYGPGPTLVPAELVAHFKHAEQASEAEERKLRRERAVVIGPRGRQIDVDPTYFGDNGMDSLPIAVDAR